MKMSEKIENILNKAKELVKGEFDTDVYLKLEIEYDDTSGYGYMVSVCVYDKETNDKLDVDHINISYFNYNREEYNIASAHESLSGALKNLDLDLDTALLTKKNSVEQNIVHKGRTYKLVE